MTLLDTAKTVLVPAELFEKGNGDKYLTFNGMAPVEGEIVVESEPVDGIVAVMAVPADRVGEGAVLSDLLSVVDRSRQRFNRKRGVVVELGAANVCIVVWDDGLRMAEVLPDNSVDSILYYMQVVGRRFTLRRFDIHVGGQRAGIVADMLRKYYSKVRVV